MTPHFVQETHLILGGAKQLLQTFIQLIKASLHTSSVVVFKDTHREKAPSNKTPALKKSMNVGVWAVSTLSQLFIRGF